jgi:hypothetical protein
MVLISDKTKVVITTLHRTGPIPVLSHSEADCCIDAGALCIRTLLPIFPKKAIAGKNWLTLVQRLYHRGLPFKNTEVHYLLKLLAIDGSETN